MKKYGGHLESHSLLRNSLPGIGTEWDKAENERIRNLDIESLQKLSLPRLREKLFTKVVAERLSQPHGHLTGTDLDAPEYLASMLLFSDTLIISVCPHCLTGPRLATISLLMERGLAVPIVGWYYSKFEHDSLEFLQTYQDEQISMFANERYLFAALVRTPIREMTSYDHYCRACLQEKTTKIQSEAQLSPKGLKGLAWASRNLVQVPSYMMMHLADILEGEVRSRSVRGIWQCAAEAGAIANLEFDRAFESMPALNLPEYAQFRPAIRSLFPQVSPMIGEMMKFSASGLHVSYSPDMPLKEYLDIVTNYRGTLRDFFKSQSDPAKAIEAARNTVADLNKQFDEIGRSRRYRWGTYAMNSLRIPTVIKFLLRVSLHGGHGVEAVISDWLKPGGKSETEEFPRVRQKSPRLQERILSQYFAKELPLVQQWSLRRQVSNLRRKPIRTPN